MSDRLNAARQRLQDGAYTCVVLCGSQEYISHERGVKPLLSLLESGLPCDNAVAADKTVGAGAAYLYVLLGIRALWANVISVSARQILTQNGIAVLYGECVPHILNRRADGICPMEEAVADAKTADEAYRLILNTLATLEKRSAQTT